MAYINTILNDGAVLAYALDDARIGGVMQDVGPNYLNGSYSSTVASMAGPVQPSTALSLSRTGHALLNDPLTGIPVGTSARTLEIWCYRTDSTGGTFIGYATGSQSFVFQCALSGGLTYVFTDGVNSGNNQTISGAQLPALNTWELVSFSKTSGSAWEYCLNGVSITSGTFPVTISTPSTGGLKVGERPGTSQPWAGGLAYAAIYPTVLTTAQLRAHYIAGKSEPRMGGGYS